MASSVQTDDYTNILLVGGTGKGKSSTGNSILETSSFYASDSTSSVTKDCQIDYNQVLGGKRKVKVVDTPGLADTDLSSAESIQKFSEAIQKALCLCLEGFDGIPIVIDFTRLGEPEKQTLKALKSVLSNDFVRNHAILVVTHGDEFEEENFESWSREQGGLFREIREECGGRVVLFDNETTDEAVKKAQLTKLFAKVDEIKQSGQTSFTKKDFDDADPTRQTALAQAQESQAREGFMRDVRLIMRKVQRVDVGQMPQVCLDELKDLEGELDTLHANVNIVDNNTGACQAIYDVIDAVEATIKEKQAGVKMSIDNEKRRQEIKEQIDKMTQDSEAERERFKTDMEAANKKMDDLKESFAQKEREAETRFRASMESEKSTWLDSAVKLLQVAGPLLNTYMLTRPNQTLNIDARQWHYDRLDTRSFNRMNLLHDSRALNFSGQPRMQSIGLPARAGILDQPRITDIGLPSIWANKHGKP